MEEGSEVVGLLAQKKAEIVYLTSGEVKDRICQVQDKDRSLRSSEVIADVDLSQAENKLQLVNGIRQK